MPDKPTPPPRFTNADRTPEGLGSGDMRGAFGPHPHGHLADEIRRARNNRKRGVPWWKQMEDYPKPRGE